MATRHEEEEGLSHECKEPFTSPTLEEGWKVIPLTQYHGFWLPPQHIPAAIASNQDFVARKDDIILATLPKSGTTWLKALVFSVVNRTRYDFHDHPLLNTNPHDLVPFLEAELYLNNQISDLTNLPSPRLFQVHLPCTLLPRSITESNCRIVYMCRNPKDTFISLFHFLNKLLPNDAEPIPIKEAFELFSRGISPFGSFWDHVLGYWKASLERPERVLFMKYEEMKEDSTFHLRRLAEFLGCPFSIEEEGEGIVEEISRLCSFENLRNLEVNKVGKIRLGHVGKHFFRRGTVGDWANHLKPRMIERLDQITQEKFQGSGLAFKES